MVFQSDPDRAYQAFEQQLQQLDVHLGDPDISFETVKATVDQMQHWFQQMQTIDEGKTPESHSRVQPIQTEIAKQLRLLETDLLFLRAARHPQTLQQRKTQMGDRLKLLHSYCDALLNA